MIMRMKCGLFLSSVLLFCLIGCAHDEANRFYLKQRLPPKMTEDVEILYEAPSRAFTVIADFQALNSNEKHMQKQAAQIGADAVIVGKTGGYYSESEVWADQDRHQSGDRRSRVIATAIVYK